MSKKFSIVNAINFEKLDNEIEAYVNCNCNFDPYIFMSEDTAKAIRKELLSDIVGFNPENTTKNVTYCGYKVFIDNDLHFGIVEIR